MKKPLGTSSDSQGGPPDPERRKVLTGAARLTLAALVGAVLPRVRQAYAGGVMRDVPIETWREWTSAALQAIAQGVDRWAQNAQLAGGVVNASTVFLKPGSISGPSFEQFVYTFMQNAGAPADVAAGFAGVSWEAWQTWAASYHATINRALPDFAAVPAFEAPETPLRARSLKKGTAPGKIGMTVDVLTQALAQVLPDRMNDPSAGVAIEEFTRAYSAGFSGWFRRTTLINVLGKGPIPSFAPPYVPVGPVVAGEVYGTNVLEAPPFLA